MSLVYQIVVVVDNDNNGYITIKEFEKILESQRFRSYMEQMELHIFDAKTFFEDFSPTGDDTFPIEDIVHTCMKLRGEAKAIEMHSVITMIERISAEHRRFQLETDLNMDELLKRTRVKTRP